MNHEKREGSRFNVQGPEIRPGRRPFQKDRLNEKRHGLKSKSSDELQF
jgi:hypothetical protein